MIVAIVIMLFVCLVLSRYALAVNTKFWKLLMINLAVLIFYNVIIGGCVLLFWRGEEGIIPVFFDLLITAIHLLVLLVMIITNAVKRQKKGNLVS
ncbi:hypothetical protein [Mucilaginibacter celer]|uniref:Uncharacterized protein n=1 Tax=Mucilaginibacter celer TaxID=2305508 RepID=A0A494W0A5_9SPHI|nr:hypothetical protein [Mucilaginibacter celer]AYL99190.1 hypothetical protein HYN43_029695 [Mucilaginibacter celer]